MKKKHPEALKESPKASASQFLKFTWVAVVLLAIILAGVGLAYMTCRKGTQEPFREPAAGIESSLRASGIHDLHNVHSRLSLVSQPVKTIKQGFRFLLMDKAGRLFQDRVGGLDR